MNFGEVKQIAYLVADLESGINAWMDQLAVGPWTMIRNIPLTCTYMGEASVPVIDIGLAFQGNVQIELIQQRNEAPSPYLAYFQQQNLGMHHIAYISESIDADIAAAEAQGLEIVCDIRMPDGSRYSYHQNPALGNNVFIEFIEATPFQKHLFSTGPEAAANWEGQRDIAVIDFAAPPCVGSSSKE